MNIFLICSVRGADDGLLARQSAYVDALEKAGHRVHYPPRDTDQAATGLEICTQNAGAIAAADEVHIFFNPNSTGSHFDMGVTFALGKPIVIADCPPPGPGKSYARMLHEWAAEAERAAKKKGGKR